jgi:hypothetical protein
MNLLQLIKDRELMKKNYALIQQFEYDAECNKVEKYFKEKLDELYKNIKPPKSMVVNYSNNQYKENHNPSVSRVRQHPEMTKPEQRVRSNKENTPQPVVQHIEPIDNTTPSTIMSISDPIVEKDKKKNIKPRPKVNIYLTTGTDAKGSKGTRATAERNSCQ